MVKVDSYIWMASLLFLSASSSPIPIANTSAPLPQGNITGLSFPLYTTGADDGLVFASATFASGVNALLTFRARTGAIAGSIENPRTKSTKLSVQAFGNSAIAGGKEQHAVVFTGTAVTEGGSQVDGVFLQMRGSEQVLAIALTGTSVVDTSVGEFAAFGDVALAISAEGRSVQVAFQASKVGGRQSIYTAEVSGEELPDLTLVADTSMTIPGSKGLNFLCLSSPAIDKHGTVVFFGSHCVSRASAFVSQQWARHRMFRKHRWGDHCLFKNMGYTGQVVADHVFPGIFLRSSHGPLQVVASSATVVPGSSPTSFQAFSAPTIGADGTVAFVALTSLGEGVYASSNHVMRSVANVSTPLPNEGTQTFGDFPYAVSVASDGLVLFYADAPLAYSGIYSETQGGGLQAELTQADSVEGQGIVFIGLGSSAYDEASDSFATYLVLDDTTDGIWVFQRAERKALELELAHVDPLNELV